MIGPALTWTVFTLTGFIGSDEPGIAAIGWVWMTPLVSGAGLGLGWRRRAAAAAAAAHQRRLGRRDRARSARAAGSGAAEAT